MNKFLEACKHDQGFKFLTNRAMDRMPGAWYCNNGCGYFLCFDPFEFPNGIAYKDRSMGTKEPSRIDMTKGKF